MKRAFLDIDTQIDFMLPTGALYAPGAEKIITAIATLNRYAVDHGITLISTACAHTEDDPEFRTWGPHCVSGTVGQQKPAATLVGQTIVEKPELDAFRSPDFVRQLDADEYILYGVVTEICVKLAAEGLLKRGTPVTIVTDAIQALDAAAGDLFLRDFVSRGGKLARLVEVCK